MRIQPLFPMLLLCLITLSSSFSAHADMAIIVNAGNTVAPLNKKQVIALYFGHRQTFPNGAFATVLDMERDSAEREQFFHLLSGMTLSQVNKYWARLMFSGRVLPPQTLANDRAMIDQVKHNPAAIGYINSLPIDEGVKVILILKDN